MTGLQSLVWLPRLLLQKPGGECGDGLAVGPAVSTGRIYMFLAVQVHSFLFLMTSQL